MEVKIYKNNTHYTVSNISFKIIVFSGLKFYYISYVGDDGKKYYIVPAYNTKQKKVYLFDTYNIVTYIPEDISNLDYKFINNGGGYHHLINNFMSVIPLDAERRMAA